MVIEKSFDELKKILEDPERANKLVAYSNFSGNLTITESTKDSIVARYRTGKFCYDISFFRRDSNGIKRIEYQFKATNYFWLPFLLLIFLYKHEDFGGFLEAKTVFIVFSGFMFGFLYLINSEVRKGIYNRIHNRWDDVSL
jgi:hypothetical protein